MLRAPAMPVSTCGSACTTSLCGLVQRRSRTASLDQRAGPPLGPARRLRGRDLWRSSLAGSPINEPYAFAMAGWRPASIRPDGAARRTSTPCSRTPPRRPGAWRLLRSGDQPSRPFTNLSPIFTDTAADQELVGPDRQPHVGVGSSAYATAYLKVGRRSALELDDLAGSFDLVGFTYYSATRIAADGRTRPYPSGLPGRSPGYVPWAEASARCSTGSPRPAPSRPARLRERHPGPTMTTSGAVPHRVPPTRDDAIEDGIR